MFKFLKDKLKKVVNKFSKEVEDKYLEVPEETAQEIIEDIKEEIQEKAQSESAQEIVNEVVENLEPVKVVYEDKPMHKKGFINKVKETILGSPEELREEKDVEEEKEKIEHEQKIKATEEKELKKEIKEAEKVIEHPPKKEKEHRISEEKTEKLLEEAEEVEKVIEIKEEITQPKKGLFGKLKETITKTQLSDEKFEELFWELEVALMENNVATEVVEKIKEDLKKELTLNKISRMGVEQIIKTTLKNSINELFDIEPINILEEINQKKEKPYVIAFVGINGSGKTTSAAKLAKKLIDNNLEVVLAAADTFRVAAIEQLEHHANALGVKMIKHNYGSDAAAVCFDAIEHAKSKNKQVVIIDTAGRSNANVNLMDELKKVIKVAKPDLVLFVGDALTGNDAVEQAQEFDKAVGINGIILTKSDADDKGGCAISITYVTKKPILYFGTGQNYEDLQEFSPDIVIKNLGLE